MIYNKLRNSPLFDQMGWGPGSRVWDLSLELVDGMKT